MRERINKPRVFLSHARKDVAFIERIENDLRRCQVLTWRDQYEIRDGQPWMSAIFEDGIPTCDAILAYFTENSLGSSMVAKEVDTAILRRLSDSKVAFLPYVKDDATRGKLRVDIQTLQCRAWNDENYHEILPSVVAEIWRSYFERNVENAVATERARRLELELELQNLRLDNSFVFTPSEEKEFSYLRRQLDRDIEVALTLNRQEKDNGPARVVGKEVYRASLLGILLHYIGRGAHTFSKSSLEVILYEHLGEVSPPAGRAEGVKAHPFGSIKENLALELQVYGLARVKEADNYDLAGHFCEFTDKMYRFKYWLDFNGLDSGLSFERMRVENVADGNPEGEDRDLPYVLKVDEDLSFLDRRERWRTTEEGVLAARQQVARLHGELERLVKLRNEKMSSIKVVFDRKDESHCVISGRQSSLSIRWECKRDDSLEGAVLAVEGYEIQPATDANGGPTERRRTYQTEYTVDLKKDSNVYWRGKSEREGVTSEELAGRLLSHLLSDIKRSAEKSLMG
jgi:hypothetical protein